MIKSICLFNFRCYEYIKILLENKINIIIGKNATGKSSIIESIYLLGTSKSFRTNTDTDMIKFESEFYSVIAETNVGKIVYSNNKGEKKITINDEVIKSASKYVGTVNVVLFSPEDLKLIKDEPKYRRKFLDICISQINKEYLISLMEYNKVLKERNELLKQIEESSYLNEEFNKSEKYDLLEMYTKVLVEKGKKLIKYRKEFVEKLDLETNIKVKNIKKEENVSLLYAPNVSINDYETEIKKRIKHDIYLKTTTCGPHRDDFQIILNEKNASDFGSQGQQRTIALAIKLGYSEILKKEKEDVIIMMDDMFGELDDERQRELMNIFNEDFQIIVTTTSEKYIDKEIINKSNVIKL